MKVEQDSRARSILRSFQRRRCASGTRRRTVWAKSPLTTTASTARRCPPASTAAARPPANAIRSTGVPSRISAPRRRATVAIASDTAPQPPIGWNTPCSCSRKLRMVNRLGQRNGDMPRYLVWNENASRTRGSLK
jgi:hypothetical protein